MLARPNFCLAPILLWLIVRYFHWPNIDDWVSQFTMSASINKLNDHGREDRFLVPCLPIGELYEYDDNHIVVVKDKAQAATNAIAEVFDAEIHEAMCVTHAAI